MLAGAKGSSPMPRKMAGSEMMTIDPSTVAMNTPRVVFDSATHLYRSSPSWARAPERTRLASSLTSPARIRPPEPRRGPLRYPVRSQPLRQPVQQWQYPEQPAPLRGGELVVQCPGDPLGARRPAIGQQGTTGRGDRHQYPPPVGRVRGTPDQPALFECGKRGTHRLRAYP